MKHSPATANLAIASFLLASAAGLPANTYRYAGGLQDDLPHHNHTMPAENEERNRGTVLIASTAYSVIDTRSESLASAGYETLSPQEYRLRLTIQPGAAFSKSFISGTIHNLTNRHFRFARIYVDFTDRKGEVLRSCVMTAQDLKAGKSGRLYAEYAKHAVKYVVTRVEVLP